MGLSWEDHYTHYKGDKFNDVFKREIFFEEITT